mgnify:CR=1 FL=1
MQNNPYQSLLNLKDTEKAIKIVKDTFEMHLAKNLHLLRVSAPLLVHPSTGLNDDLNGVCVEEFTVYEQSHFSVCSH